MFCVFDCVALVPKSYPAGTFQENEDQCITSVKVVIRKPMGDKCHQSMSSMSCMKERQGNP